MPKVSGSLPASEKGPSVWIFGYGSLIWNTGFSYDESRKAVVRGYSLRMYQGNTFHRGDAALPGRVATLIKDKQSYACGLIFRVTGIAKIKAALKHLYEREVLNGYEFSAVHVEPVTSKGANDDGTTQIMALTCIANADNEFYLGPGPLSVIGEQIALARGRAGPNSDYLFKLINEIRVLFPNYSDNHLFALEYFVLQRRQRT